MLVTDSPAFISAMTSKYKAFHRPKSMQTRRNAWFGVLAVAIFALGTGRSAGAQGTSTSLAVTSASGPVNSVPSGTVVTLTATVQAGSAALTLGQVNFCDASAAYCTDIHLLGTAQLTSAGTAVYRFRPAPGTHRYKAVFLGTKSYAGGASSASALTVGPAPSAVYTDSTMIRPTGGPGNYTLTATVLGVGGSAAPTGNVSFLDTKSGNASLATAPLGAAATGSGFLVSQTPALTNTPSSQVTGDFNGDGITDLALIWSNGAYSNSWSVTILFGNGDGTFVAGPTTSATGVQSSPVLLAGDFNGDGKTDLVMLSSSYSVTSYITTMLGNGDGTFAKPSTSTAYDQGASGGDFISGSMVAADFDGDGKLDLAVVGDYVSVGGVIILVGNGDGTFTAKPNLLPSVGFSLVTTGDFNGDGIPDLVAIDWLGPGGTVLLGNGDGTFTASATALSVGYYPTSIVSGDFNADGKLDLALGNDSNVLVLLGNGDATFRSGPNSSIFGTSQGLVVGDFSQDGLPDLAGYGHTVYGDSITLYSGTGNGNFTPIVPAFVPSQQFNNPAALLTADFNGDGVPDLALLPGYVQTSSILLTQPTQTATATVTSIAPVGAQTHDVEASYPGDSNYPASVSATTPLTAGVAPPTFSPSSGTFTSAQSVTITDSTPNATIYYEAPGTNGFVPYTGPIPLQGSGSVTIQAYATETGYQPSQYGTATFTLNYPAAATPIISLAPGWYPGTQTVTLTDSSPGSIINYSTDGTPPSYSSVYSGPITISSSEIVVAGAAGPGYAPSKLASAQYEIGSSSSSFLYPFAGSGTSGYGGDGGQATAAELNGPNGVAVDSAGNVYMTDTVDNVVRKVTASTGIITTIAGTGVGGHTGDGGAATSAELWQPQAIAVDATGDVFVAEAGDQEIRRIDGTTGTITTFAGNRTGTGALGGPAVNFPLVAIYGLACDRPGNLYIEVLGFHGSGSQTLEVNAGTGNITQVAGSLINSGLYPPGGIAVDGAQNIYVSDGSHLVWKISPSGNATVFAGGGTSYGNGVSATQALLNVPLGLAVDTTGNVYINVANEGNIQVVDTTGVIHTVAGLAYFPFSGGLPLVNGDGAPTASIADYATRNIAVDNAGDVYLADPGTHLLRKITAPAPPPASATAQPVFSVAAGSYAGPQTLTLSDPAPGAKIYITLDGSTPSVGSQGYHGAINITGNVTVQAVALAPGYLVSAPIAATYTITTPPPTTITTVAGNGSDGFSGAGGPATNAQLGGPQAVAFDGAGNLYIADTLDGAVWRVSEKSGNVSVVAGTGTGGTGPDGGLATTTQLSNPEGLAFDTLGNLYIAEAGNNRIRMVSAQTGIITTVAGSSPHALGDGGPATSASLSQPADLAFDSAGNLYVADTNNQRVRKISAATGIITTVVGSGIFGGPLGDAGLATSANFRPVGIAFDSAGNLYIADSSNYRIRRVDTTTGIISTVAGNGIEGNSGDGGLATAAAINPSFGITLDSSGNIYFSASPDTVRRVDAITGIITTVAGVGYLGYSGDGGSATVAELQYPEGIALDSAGNLYIADKYNYVVRRVAGSTAAPSFSLAAGTYKGTQTLTLSDGTPGAIFYYTTDGSTPTAGSTAYSGPITVPATETVKAIAIAPGYTQSAVSSAAYTINQPVLPSIAWPVPGSIVYGTALSGLQLNATSSVPGRFVYSPSLGAILSAGTQTLSVTFTPTDAIDYLMTTATVKLPVKQATPAVTWAAPAPIVYGAALSTTQLNATASVPGSFVYNPAAGGFPAPGSDTLTVVFTPTDATDYTTASASVTLIVAQPAPILGGLSPAFESAGGPAFTLTATGSGFAPASIIEWGSTALSTQFVSGTQLTAQVPASAIANAGTAGVTVQNPSPGGGTSNPLQFEIDSAGSNTPPSFTVATSTVMPGSSATYPVTLPMAATLVSATCLNLPSGTTCTYSATSSAVTITTSSTTPAGTYQILVVFTETLPVAATAMVLLPVFLSPLARFKRKRAAKGFRFAACVAVLAAAAVAATGCGGRGTSTTSQPQTRQVTSSATVTLTVH